MTLVKKNDNQHMTHPDVNSGVDLVRTLLTTITAQYTNSSASLVPFFRTSVTNRIEPLSQQQGGLQVLATTTREASTSVWMQNQFSTLFFCILGPSKLLAMRSSYFASIFFAGNDLQKLFPDTWPQIWHFPHLTLEVQMWPVHFFYLNKPAPNPPTPNPLLSSRLPPVANMQEDSLAVSLHV